MPRIPLNEFLVVRMNETDAETDDDQTKFELEIINLKSLFDNVDDAFMAEEMEIISTWTKTARRGDFLHVGDDSMIFAARTESRIVNKTPPVPKRMLRLEVTK